MKTIEEVKEQLQEDLLTLFEGFGINEAMDKEDYERFKNATSDIVLKNLNNLKV